MNNRSTAMSGVIFAVTVLTACGGGGSAMDGEAITAAPAPVTAGAGRAPTQTSPDSVAHTGTILDPLVVNRVKAELDQIEHTLRRVDDGEAERQEALEVVSDARAELQKERPNKLKLRSLLGGLAQGVQVLGGLKGAGKLLGQLVPMI